MSIVPTGFFTEFFLNQSDVYCIKRREIPENLPWMTWESVKNCAKDSISIIFDVLSVFVDDIS